MAPGFASYIRLRYDNVTRQVNESSAVSCLQQQDHVRGRPSLLEFQTRKDAYSVQNGLFCYKAER
jgi:hypothetical protein